ncbi:oxidoreductase-like domain-containing protein [Hydrogenophaga sp.]|uniref:oxidoreductase-like domain-containing protein n=1 Tax=Hydrogenophaga sp. TaxID=1904254 RepID=UPI0025C45D46|nr:oxidoreductase-like domain-containing protein [Hydrogenophaga sp.]
MNLDAALRPPPPEPATCCGRGCNGCVWEGFYEALHHWRTDALALLRTTTAAPAGSPA